MNSRTAKTAAKFSSQTQIPINLHKPVKGINRNRTRLIRRIVVEKNKETNGGSMEAKCASLPALLWLTFLTTWPRRVSEQIAVKRGRVFTAKAQVTA